MIGGRWSGVDGAVEALEGIASACARDEVVAEAMLQASKPVVDAMQVRATDMGLYRTGAMVEALEAAQVHEGTQEGVVAVEIGPHRGAKHAHLWRFWELGTSRFPARPVMRPTWDEHEATWATAVTAALRKAYETVAARFARKSAEPAWRQEMRAASTKGEFMGALRKMAPRAGD